MTDIDEYAHLRVHIKTLIRQRSKFKKQALLLRKLLIEVLHSSKDDNHLTMGPALMEKVSNALRKNK